MNQAAQVPYLRLIALAAFLIVAGVFGLRLNAAATESSNPAAVASPIQTALSTILGASAVSVVESEAAGTILILLNSNSEAVQSRTDAQVEALIEPVLPLAADGSRASLSISRQVFSQDNALSLSSQSLAELIGLAMAGGLLIIIAAFVPSYTQPHEITDPVVGQHPQPAEAPVVASQKSHTLQHAERLATEDPIASAEVVRRWLSDSGATRS